MNTMGNEMNMTELNLDEMEMVNGGWSWKNFGLGAGVGGILGGLVAGTVAVGLVASGPVGWCMLGGALVGGAAVGSYAGTKD